MKRLATLATATMLAMCVGCAGNGRVANPMTAGQAVRVPPPRTGVLAQTQPYYNASASAPNAAGQAAGIVGRPVTTATFTNPCEPTWRSVTPGIPSVTTAAGNGCNNGYHDNTWGADNCCAQPPAAFVPPVVAQPMATAVAQPRY